MRDFFFSVSIYNTMKILISESQFKKILHEADFNPKDLCNSFGEKSKFCNKIQTLIQDWQKGGRENNLKKISVEFFKKVLQSGVFSTIDLEPGVPEYDERYGQLGRFRDILDEYGVCQDIIDEVDGDMEKLPSKGLKMVVDGENRYSLLNRLDSHYSAKAFLLTHRMIEHLNMEWKDIDDEKLRSELRLAMSIDNVNSIAEELKNLLDTNKEFSNYFYNSLKYSREQGNKVESSVFNALRNKYGEDNVFEFSGDFGFVDYFGVDGIVVINGFAHPVQISSSVKTPEIFKYSSSNCRPIGFYVSGKKIIRYEPVD